MGCTRWLGGWGLEDEPPATQPSCETHVKTALGKQTVLGESARGSGALAADRQDDPEGGPPAGSALELDPTTVIGHDALADREAEAGPLADRLGREERVEDPRADRRRDPAAIVGDLEHDVVAVGPGGDDDPARVAARAFDGLHG